MLIIKRKESEVIRIEPLEGIDTSKSIRDLFQSGAIEIRLLKVGRNRVTVAIDAPPSLRIWRGDSVNDGPAEVAQETVG